MARQVHTCNGTRCCTSVFTKEETDIIWSNYCHVICFNNNIAVVHLWEKLSEKNSQWANPYQSHGWMWERICFWMIIFVWIFVCDIDTSHWWNQRTDHSWSEAVALQIGLYSWILSPLTPIWDTYEGFPCAGMIGQQTQSNELILPALAIVRAEMEGVTLNNSELWTGASPSSARVAAVLVMSFY